MTCEKITGKEKSDKYKANFKSAIAAFNIFLKDKKKVDYRFGNMTGNVFYLWSLFSTIIAKI